MKQTLLLILFIGLVQASFAAYAMHSIASPRSVWENNFAHLCQNGKAAIYLNEILDPIENRWKPVMYSGLIVSGCAAALLVTQRKP